MTARERYVEAYWDRVVEEVRRLLGEQGIKFCRDVLEKCGTLEVTMPGPHPIKNREGAIVLRVIRRITCGHWREKDYDQFWQDIIKEAISLDDRLRKALLDKRSTTPKLRRK